MIAPDSFGRTLTAAQAAQAIADGWRSARPHDELVLAPQSDGGPGFVEVLAKSFAGAPRPDQPLASGGRADRAAEPAEFGVHLTVVNGPLGEQTPAAWLLAPGPDGEPVAYIESAQACGLHLVDPDPLTAMEADSVGVGELIAAALDAGAWRIVVGLGGTACTEGGMGMLVALAASAGDLPQTFADGGPSDDDPPSDVAQRMIVAAARQAVSTVDLVAATDVDNPFLGPSGAARVFGPQKGADPVMVEVLEMRNAEWAKALGPVADLPGAGAAGGIGAALFAIGAERLSGAAVVAEATGQSAELAEADLVITGEGRFDEQSLGGKLVVALAGAAREHGTPVVVLAGQLAVDQEQLAPHGIVEARSLAEHAGSVVQALTEAPLQLASLAAAVARDWRG